ncbi:hypothetical protein [Frigoribacterium sp. RIT-PI-h]|uniref:hypothetical protein n=1 Tax=Frigoribacterium sp. RIT-PI-h TaxID=1690245 RepID=UPI001379149F|nr:hypothetical protein [Frigoribacterium sp. RIT-PI-h]
MAVSKLRAIRAPSAAAISYSRPSTGAERYARCWSATSVGVRPAASESATSGAVSATTWPGVPSRTSTRPSRARARRRWSASSTAVPETSGAGAGSSVQARARVSSSQTPSEPASPATVGRPSRLSNAVAGAAVPPDDRAVPAG